MTELSNPEDSRSPFDPFEKKDENQDFDDAGVDGSTYIKKRHLPNRIIFLHLVPLSETFGRHFTNNYKTTLTIDFASASDDLKTLFLELRTDLRRLFLAHLL